MWGKIISLLLLSSVKFVFAFPLAIKYHFSVYTTFLITSLGGICGILFFSFFWNHVINLYLWFIHSYLYNFPNIRSFLKKIKNFFIRKNNSNGSIPYRRKRHYIWIKKNGGLLGIALLTPLILSIPIGTFLAVRFFGRNLRTLLFLIITLEFWAVLLSILVYFVGVRF